MKETQLFKEFIPPNAKYLLLGGFTAAKKTNDNSYDWFYCTKRNQFWSIIEQVYQIKLETTEKKKKLFAKLGIAIADTIFQCERRHGNSSDSNLSNQVYNSVGVRKILRENEIEKILFTSRFAEKIYRRHFSRVMEEYPSITLITLPSPSPRYAMLSKAEKMIVYKEELPLLN